MGRRQRGWLGQMQSLEGLRPGGARLQIRLLEILVQPPERSRFPALGTFGGAREVRLVNPESTKPHPLFRRRRSWMPYICRRCRLFSSFGHCVVLGRESPRPESTDHSGEAFGIITLEKKRGK